MYVPSCSPRTLSTPKGRYMKKMGVYLTHTTKMNPISVKAIVTFKDVAVATKYSMHTLKILKSFAEKRQEFLLRWCGSGVFFVGFGFFLFRFC